MKSQDLLIRPLRGLPAVAAGDDLVGLALRSIKSMNDELQDGDVLVITQKIVSKMQGRSVDLASVVASAEAIELARKTNKDARLVELILRESSEVVRAVPGLIIVAHRLGFILANAGIDRSNSSGTEVVLLLPEDPDGSADEIRSAILARTGKNVGVVIIDSIGRAWRLGTVGTAIGVSGMPALLDLRGNLDLDGRPLESTEIGLADELAAASSLVMGQADEGTPIVLVRGVPYERLAGKATDLVRPKNNDLFR
ncbi:coenzyme F420-0:L-glutamate ligase [Bradyrhizobium sp. AUGA SZCCT0182]|jgi:coenzyme F420-0:L-glutamate ligase / coenzyme F420-1:gamma-L-glutamate ligase|uniref:coenzyme F420-0:L-glutamate ligase n=1 Tax=Bradyrhizobium sp. AUGA SZCCT0182 TaxID=2807667 RepID=UPI001BAE4225|nr:coenzyme F420-0:L-glutamate ligase [Bradyrhizobium sp. AUGA SZCCT0182]MBR1231723.1 coenzyme F420-0:L-glutamate ligase [Bradyrhizobium sp. AUGA SZCCT0182]